MRRRAMLALGALLLPGAAMSADVQPPAPIVIAHRGASGERPEHTLAAYERAIDQGADYIEPDLVMTRDGHLVARHENEISGTTDVADHPEFADRKTVRTIDGHEVTGWFTEDFSSAELRTLRARERLPQLRPANARLDGLYTVPTLEEIIALVRAKQAETGRTIGIYPETKHPGYFASHGLDIDAALVAALDKAGYRTAQDAVFIQSFEIGNLKRLNAMTGVRLIQLMAGEGGPADHPDLSYAEMATPSGLREIALYADGIGVEKSMVMPVRADGTLGAATALVGDAHSAGLKVHAWTFRRENYFLPPTLRSDGNPGKPGDLAAEIRIFANSGIDGLFTDNPQVAAEIFHPH